MTTKSLQMCFLIAPKWDPVTKLHLYVCVTFQFWTLTYDVCLCLSVAED